MTLKASIQQILEWDLGSNERTIAKAHSYLRDFFTKYEGKRLGVIDPIDLNLNLLMSYIQASNFGFYAPACVLLGPATPEERKASIEAFRERIVITGVAAFVNFVIAEQLYLESKMVIRGRSYSNYCLAAAALRVMGDPISDVLVHAMSGVHRDQRLFDCSPAALGSRPLEEFILYACDPKTNGDFIMQTPYQQLIESTTNDAYQKAVLAACSYHDWRTGYREGATPAHQFMSPPYDIVPFEIYLAHHVFGVPRGFSLPSHPLFDVVRFDELANIERRPAKDFVPFYDEWTRLMSEANPSYLLPEGC